MFEKEAEEYGKQYSSRLERKLAFQAGAEFVFKMMKKDLEELTITSNSQKVISDKNEQLSFLETVNAKLKDDLSYAKDLLTKWASDEPITKSEHKDLISDTENFLEDISK